MLTQTMPSVVSALAKALPADALKQLTQALGNCNQPLTHRAGLNVQPSEYLYDNAKAPSGRWNPSDYRRLLPYAGQTINNFDVPGWTPGSDWNSYNYSGDNFYFPTNQDFNTNNYYGGPTVNVGGNVFFDNTQTNNLTTQELTTQNLNVDNINVNSINNNSVSTTNNFYYGGGGGTIMPTGLPPGFMDWLNGYLGEWWSRQQMPNSGEVRVPQHAHESRTITYAKEGISKVSGTVDVTVISGLTGSLEMPVDSIRGGTVAVTSIPTNAISGGTVTIPGIPTNAIAAGTLSMAGIPSNAISGGTVAVTGIPTNAISGGWLWVPEFTISGGTVAITGVPANSISGGTLSVSLSPTTTSVFNATGVTFDANNCSVALLGSNVSVMTGVSVSAATFYGITASTTTRTASLSAVPAQQGQYSLNVTAAATTTRAIAITGIAAATTSTTATITGTAAATTSITAAISGVAAAATTRVCTLIPDTANFDLVGVTVSATTQTQAFAVTIQTTAATTATTTLAGPMKTQPPYIKSVLIPAFG